MSDYYYSPLMAHPYWVVDEETDTARNLDADTDMGDLSVAEFRQMIPLAMPITQEQAIERGATPKGWVAWFKERPREGVK